jgi:hypothetical protein
MKVYPRSPVVITTGLYPTGQQVDLKILRVSDGFWLDFSDDLFKDSGWVNDQDGMTQDDNLVWRYAWTAPKAVDAYRVLLVDTTAGITSYDPEIIEVSGGMTFLVVADAGNSATVFKTDLTETANDFFKAPGLVKFLNGNLLGCTPRRLADASAYNGTTKVLTVASAFTATPDDGARGLLITG